MLLTQRNTISGNTETPVRPARKMAQRYFRKLIIFYSANIFCEKMPPSFCHLMFWQPLSCFWQDLRRKNLLTTWSDPGMGGCPGTGTQCHETKICGTVLVLKFHGTQNPDIFGQESWSVPGRSRCPGILCDASPASPAGQEGRLIRDIKEVI